MGLSKDFFHADLPFKYGKATPLPSAGCVLIEVWEEAGRDGMLGMWFRHTVDLDVVLNESLTEAPLEVPFVGLRGAALWE